MALHRDIFWIGRQWAVTGHGMQLIDQRLEGAFDIEAARLWDDDLIGSLRAKAWLKAEDFDNGLAVARKRNWQPEATSVVVPPLSTIEPIAPPLPPAAESPPAIPAESPRQQSPELSMKTDGRARFARPWRVWMRGKT